MGVKVKAWDAQLRPEVSAIRPTATSFRHWAATLASDAVAADCELALVEACNNLIQHNRKIPEPIRIHAEATARELTIILRDSTKGFDWPKRPQLPSPTQERGRGIYLMHALMTEVEYHRNGTHNELRLRRAL